VNKQKKTAAELEEIVKQRIGAGDFKVTVHANPETGWHATIYGRQLHDPRTSDALSVDLDRLTNMLAAMPRLLRAQRGISGSPPAASSRAASPAKL
jgi:hypothetical protein